MLEGATGAAAAEAPGDRTHVAVSLEILEKAIGAVLATAVTAQLGPGAAVLGAVLGTLAPEAVRAVVRRLGGDPPGLAAPAGLTTLFAHLDGRLARLLRRAFGELLPHLGGAGRALATSAAAATLTVGAITAPELATGESLLTDRGTTFLGGGATSSVDLGALTAAGKTARLTVDSGDDGSVHFRARAGDRLFLQVRDLEAEGVSATGGLGVSIVAAGGRVLEERELGSSGSWSELELEKPFPAAGRYMLAVRLKGGGSVTLEVRTIPPDRRLTARLGRAATIIPVNLPTPGMRARISFAGRPGDRVFLRVHRDRFEGMSGIGGVAVAVRSPLGEELAHDDLGSTPGRDDFELPRPLVDPGRYSIVVDPGGANHGSLRLEAYAVPPDARVPVPDGKIARVPLRFRIPGERARLVFRARAGERVVLRAVDVHTVGTASISGIALAMVAPNGATLATREIGRADGWNVWRLPPLPLPGAYSTIVDLDGANRGTLTLVLARS